MLTIKAKIRKDLGKKVKFLRKKDIVPAVLYGPKTKSLPLELNYKVFEKLYKEAGESSLLKLELEPKTKEEDCLVLIYQISRDPLTEKITHVDFYQPDLEKEVEAEVPIIFEGESLAVKDLEGTLIKNISELRVKTLPQNLPKEIRVNIGLLKTFEDVISVKDLVVPTGVKILRNPRDAVASVFPPEKVEEELEKPIEEKVEEVEVIKKEKKEKETEEAAPEKSSQEKKEKSS